MNSLVAKKMGIFVLLLSLSPMACADLLGVEDALLLANAVEQLSQLQEQYNVMKNAYETSKGQLDSINQLRDANIGTSGFGAFNNGMDALNSWQNPADNWKEALEHISGGNSERYTELVKSYEASHPMLSDADYSKGASPSRLANFKYSKKVNKAISVETTKTFNEINTRLKNINTLSLKIDETPNTKSAVDLNSRLTAELAYVAVMNLKLQTLISQQLTQESANNLAEEGEMARFNDIEHQ